MAKKFNRIEYELILKKNSLTPYHLNIVKRKKLLYYPEVHQSNIFREIHKRKILVVNFEERAFKKIISFYYGGTKNG